MHLNFVPFYANKQTKTEHIVPYIETEMFVLQSKYDYWQMDNNIYCELINIDNARTFGAFFEQNFLEAFGDSSSVGCVPFRVWVMGGDTRLDCIQLTSLPLPYPCVCV